MTVVISHEDGYTTKYACLGEDVSVKPGDAVTMGQSIGTVGQTALMESALGHHLHFSVTHNDQAVDPTDFLKIGK
jgi:murein DD-endopeptidase MepM/ murein hydrolase activator NlpD